jgi:signal transduction histidine kinase
MRLRFLSGLLGRVAPDGALDQVEAKAMIAELSGRLPDDAPGALKAGANPTGLRKGRERASELAEWFCRVEDALAARVQDPQAFRAAFREESARRWPRLAAFDEMAIALSPPAQLEASLYRFFLREAWQRASDVLGSASGGKLAELGQWLETGWDRGAAAPFSGAVAASRPSAEPMAVAAGCSRGFYAWLEQSLGRRADAIYENAYQRTARQFGAADAFHVVLGLMPDKLITADKLSLLRRGQIEQVLREKIALLERANVDIELAKQHAEVALIELKAAQQSLIQSEKLASLGQLTAGIAHEIKNPLNFVNNFSALSRELVDELGELLARAPLESAQREEADELIGTIGGNLDKVVLHGKRADSIVKNMLLHSREGSGERSTTNVNAMVEEALNLAYHGARAEKPGFNVTIEKSLDPNAGAADLFPQEITRVLLNLISNAFYATMKQKQGGSNGGYEPTVTASTRNLGKGVEIAIRDNGTGVPDEVRAKMFNPFFTTKPAGEGTGLGLSLSHDIVVKQHGGAIEVSTEPGSYTQFTIVLPRARAGA